MPQHLCIEMKDINLNEKNEINVKGMHKHRHEFQEL